MLEIKDSPLDAGNSILLGDQVVISGIFWHGHPPTREAQDAGERGEH